MTSISLPKSRDEAIRSKLAIVFVAVSLSVALLYQHSPASRLWLPAALAGITIAIWHGAYDTVLAKNLWQPRYDGKWLLPFLMSYVALAALVVLTWYAFPVAALVAFLLYSGVHFGMESESGRGLLQGASAVAFGCFPIAAACHWQAASVQCIFGNMLRSESGAAGRIVAGAGALFAPCILLAGIPAWQSCRFGVRRTALIAAQLLLFRFCSPVLAFAVFFSLLHTPEHLVETSRNADSSFSPTCMWRNLRAGFIPWLVSIMVVAFAGWRGRQSLQGYASSLFIALSALTVPHMALGMLAEATARPKEHLPFRSGQRTAHP